jgi:hypothetical protein
LAISAPSKLNLNGLSSKPFLSACTEHNGRGERVGHGWAECSEDMLADCSLRAKLCLNYLMDGYLMGFCRRFYFESEGFILPRDVFNGDWLSDIVLYKVAAKSAYLIAQ